MKYLINCPLLRNNYILFIIILLAFEYIHITFFLTLNFSTSSTIGLHTTDLSKNSIEKHFEHLKPFYYPISCQNLFESDSYELKKSLNILSNLKSPLLIPDHKYNISKDQCHIYRSQRFNESFHREDTLINQRFPLAFTILMHENVEKFERLLRLIYRPQNFYCIHVDKTASLNVFEGVKSIVDCFDNVFFPKKREKVLYATFSRLQADINCMEDLIKYPSWKYLLNLANSELPLKTNSELVKILSIYHGYNDIEGRWQTKNINRTKYSWQLIDNTGSSHTLHLRMTNKEKKNPPGNIQIVKGSVYGAFSRAFVEFVQTNPVAQELLDWSRDTYSPDEHYWATLNYNTHLRTPGGYQAKSDPTNWTARFVIWDRRYCHGRMVRGICIFSTIDLPNLFDRHELFANKFDLNIDPIVYQCLEELILNRSKLDVPLRDAKFYRQMPFLLPI